jgi:transcription-repair coupling factor (superfamily II helicase)
VLRLQRLYPSSVVKDAAATVLVPRPTTSTMPGEPLKDSALLRWGAEVIKEIFPSSER